MGGRETLPGRAEMVGHEMCLEYHTCIASSTVSAPQTHTVQNFFDRISGNSQWELRMSVYVLCETIGRTLKGEFNWISVGYLLALLDRKLLDFVEEIDKLIPVRPEETSVIIHLLKNILTVVRQKMENERRKQEIPQIPFLVLLRWSQSENKEIYFDESCIANAITDDLLEEKFSVDELLERICQKTRTLEIDLD